MTSAERLAEIRAEQAKRKPPSMLLRIEELEAERDVIREQLDEALALLYEARNWLCGHPQAAQQKKDHPNTRAWCSYCHNYLYSTEDATLLGRTQAFLDRHAPKEER